MMHSLTFRMKLGPDGSIPIGISAVGWKNESPFKFPVRRFNNTNVLY